MTPIARPRQNPQLNMASTAASTASKCTPARPGSTRDWGCQRIAGRQSHSDANRVGVARAKRLARLGACGVYRLPTRNGRGKSAGASHSIRPRRAESFQEPLPCGRRSRLSTRRVCTGKPNVSVMSVHGLSETRVPFRPLRSPRKRLAVRKRAESPKCGHRRAVQPAALLKFRIHTSILARLAAASPGPAALRMWGGHRCVRPGSTSPTADAGLRAEIQRVSRNGSSQHASTSC